MAADVTWEGKHLEELAQPFRIRRFVGVALAVAAVDVDRTPGSWRTVAWSGHVDHVQVVFVDQPIGVGPDEGLARARAPVPQQAVLDVLRTQGLLEQGVVLQIDHSDGQVVGRAPIGVQLMQLLVARRCHRSQSGLMWSSGHGCSARDATTNHRQALECATSTPCRFVWTVAITTETASTLSCLYSISGQSGSSGEQFHGGITTKVRRETCPARCCCPPC